MLQEYTQDVFSKNHYMPVEHSWGVGQAIGHYQVLVVPKGQGEGSLPIVPFPNMHTVVSTHQCEFIENSGPMQVRW